MKYIIMLDTVNLLCKTQEDVAKLLETYKVKQLKSGLQYLSKEE